MLVLLFCGGCFICLFRFVVGWLDSGTAVNYLLLGFTSVCASVLLGIGLVWHVALYYVLWCRLRCVWVVMG